MQLRSYFSLSSARRAAVKNRLRRDLIQSGLLCLKVGAALIETGNDDEDDSGSKHQPSEEGKVLIVADFMRGACAQNPFIDQADEEFTRGDSEKPQRHHRTLHRVRCLGIGKFQTSDGYHRFTERENYVGQELAIDMRSQACIDLSSNPNDDNKREGGNEEAYSDFSQRGQRKDRVNQRVDHIIYQRNKNQDQNRVCGLHLRGQQIQTPSS